MDKNIALVTAGVIFTIVAMLHLARLVTKFEIAVAKKILPLWVNIIGLLITGFLAFWMFAAAQRS